jgi:hypothetical protein
MTGVVVVVVREVPSNVITASVGDPDTSHPSGR